MKKLLVLIFANCFMPIVYSQAPHSWTSSEIHLAIQKLNVLGTVLYVAAHPDDENTRLIAFFSNDKLYRTGYLSVTRGDGGQNLIGDEQGIELGLIRTQELLAARRIDGGEQFFTRAYDFGYSKNPEETFSKWNKEKILSDVVWVIRKFQPDVIITRFPVTGEGGHGHHTASAILANEAFSAAADPGRFPEQLQYVKPWQAKRILWNTFNFSGRNTTNENQFKFDVGGYNPLLGKSYGEIAAASRSQHKSQGFGVPSSRGEAFEYFSTTGGKEPVGDLFDGVETSWKRVKGGEKISSLMNNIAASFDFLRPEKSVKALTELYRVIAALPDNYWKTQKLNEVQKIIEQCSGLFLEATTTSQFAVQGDSVRINFSFNNRLGIITVLKNVVVDAFDTSFRQTLGKNKNLLFGKTLFVPYSKSITNPYWLGGKMEPGYYNVTSQQKIGQPDVDPGYTASINLSIEGLDLVFTRPVKYKFTDPVKGEIYLPLIVVPPLYVYTTTPVVYNTAKHLNSFNITVYPNRNLIVKDGMLHAGPFCDSIYLNDAVRINLVKNMPMSFEKNNYKGIKPECMDKILPAFAIAKNGLTLDWEQKRISYDHIPDIVYFKKPEIKFVYNPAETYGKKIGYITGAGDKIPEALEQMGYEVIPLGDKELARNNLNQFDAIITGVRAYNTNGWMNNHYDKLMKYVEQGGNLIVQYNTVGFNSNLRMKIGPHPFSISRNRVTNEDAPVKFLKPDHPVLNFPNKITEEDFKGWIQERSIYDAGDTTGKYEKIIAMNDPGEKPDDGSLLITRYGKGYFTYTGLALFRQLPAGVPGAYRILANLVALNSKKAI